MHKTKGKKKKKKKSTCAEKSRNEMMTDAELAGDLIVRGNFFDPINFIHLLGPYTSKRWKRRGRNGREYEITRVERVPPLFPDFFLPVDGCS